MQTVSRADADSCARDGPQVARACPRSRSSKVITACLPPPAMEYLRFGKEASDLAHLVAGTVYGHSRGQGRAYSIYGVRNRDVGLGTADGTPHGAVVRLTQERRYSRIALLIRALNQPCGNVPNPGFTDAHGAASLVDGAARSPARGRAAGWGRSGLSARARQLHPMVPLPRVQPR